MAEVWEMAAVEVADGVRRRTFSSREAVESCLGRIAATNGDLNALTEVAAEEALTAADRADRALAAGEPLGPLHGVPVAIKGNTDQAGHATTDGVPAWAQRVAPTDAPQITGLRAAGAIFLARSNTPAFSMRWCSENDLHGRTLNPWSPAHTPGGSSGGAATALASGMVPLAQGSDYGGSIRYPAFAGGVFGLRPTGGLIPHRPAAGGIARLSWTLMATDGPMARSVADLRVALSAMVRTDPRDPFAVPAQALAAAHAGVATASPNRPPGRVGLLRDPGVVAPTAPVNRALERAAELLEAEGYKVDEVDLPLFAEAYRLWYLLTIEDNRRGLPLIRELGGEGATRSFETQLAVARQWWSCEPDLRELLDGYDRQGQLVRELSEFLAELPLLLMPVSAEPPFRHGEDIASDERAIELAAANWACMAIPCLGAPALAVPVALDDGLPVGVQLVTTRFHDQLLLDAAETIATGATCPTPIDPRGR